MSERLEKSTSSNNFLKAKIQIGSSKGPINYEPKQTAFHHDDVPESKRKRKQDVIAWIRPSTLGGGRELWNQSSNPGIPVVGRYN